MIGIKIKRFVSAFGREVFLSAFYFVFVYATQEYLNQKPNLVPSSDWSIIFGFLALGGLIYGFSENSLYWWKKYVIILAGILASIIPGTVYSAVLKNAWILLLMLVVGVIVSTSDRYQESLARRFLDDSTVDIFVATFVTVTYLAAQGIYHHWF